jgi:hypothetical protein
MSLRTRVLHLYSVTADDAYRVYVIARDAVKGALWFRRWLKARSVFDKWFARFVTANLLIGGLPGVLMGIPVGLFAAGPTPSYTNFYAHNNWQLAVFMTTILVAVFYYIGIGRPLLRKLERPLRLREPSLRE